MRQQVLIYLGAVCMFRKANQANRKRNGLKVGLTDLNLLDGSFSTCVAPDLSRQSFSTYLGSGELPFCPKTAQDVVEIKD